MMPSGHPQTVALYSSVSVMFLLVSSARQFLVLSPSLGFLLFCSDSISIYKTSKCVTLAGIGCGRAVWERVSARWCWPSLVCEVESILMQFHQHSLQTGWGFVQWFLHYGFQRLMICVDYNVRLAIYNHWSNFWKQLHSARHSVHAGGYEK